jgi:predicted nucleic acid-binding protein
MILVDANVLIALIDERDDLRESAVADLEKLQKRKLRTTDAILSEVCFACPSAMQLKKLDGLIRDLNLETVGSELLPEWLDVLAWMQRYAEHFPEWADAQLAVIASAPGVRIWTYDREFRTIWRRVDGSKIPLVVN